ncbi:MAG: helix-turn-helix domain-containing protein [Candidatus Woesearchaeota archaeon]
MTLINTEKTLENIGLTKNEIKIYLALLELGSTKTGALIKKTEIHTSKVYDGLERLANKGLVSHVVIANTKHYKAVSPDRILDFLEDKKEKINEQEKQIKEILPALKLKQQLAGDETEAEIFQGWKGMETVYKMLWDTLKKGDTNYVFGASKGEDEERVRAFFNKHALRLAKKKIRQKIIFNESARGNIQESVKRPYLTEIKHMENTTPSEINIWADNTMIVILTKKPTVILVKNQKVADSFKKYFEMMWLIAKE